jgi:hypothetical protein
MHAQRIEALLATALIALFSATSVKALDKGIAGPYAAKPNQKLQLKDDQYVCVLTRVQGQFSGGGEQVVVMEDEKHAWFLQVDSQSESGVTGGAYCFRKDHFLPAPVEALVAGSITGKSPFVRWVSEVLNRNFDHEGDCGGKSTNLWLGDAAAILSGMAGKFVGGGEFARVVQSSDPNKPSYINAHSCQDSTIGAYGYSFFVGKPHSGTLPKFHNFGGALESEAKVETKGSQSKSAPLIGTDMGMCYFTKISGEFRGGGEVAEIVPGPDPMSGKEMWWLRARSKSESGIEARARCMLFIQHD